MTDKNQLLVGLITGTKHLEHDIEQMSPDEINFVIQVTHILDAHLSRISEVLREAMRNAFKQAITRGEIREENINLVFGFAAALDQHLSHNSNALKKALAEAFFNAITTGHVKVKDVNLILDVATALDRKLSAEHAAVKVAVTEAVLQAVVLGEMDPRLTKKDLQKIEKLVTEHASKVESIEKPEQRSQFIFEQARKAGLFKQQPTVAAATPDDVKPKVPTMRSRSGGG
jgi:hypothetical protein